MPSCLAATPPAGPTLPADLPLFQPRHLFHVGTEPCPDPPRSDRASHEGPCLSVSLHPLAWQRIARLGGLWTLRLTRRDRRPFRLLAVHDLSPEQQDAIVATGCSLGLCRLATLYQAWNTDEDGEWCYGLYQSRSAAEAEVDQEAGPDAGPAGTGLVTALPGLLAEPPLTAYWHSRTSRHNAAISPVFVADALLMYLADLDGYYDGLWWNELYDPAALSAPRGGLFQRVVPELNCR